MLEYIKEEIGTETSKFHELLKKIWTAKSMLESWRKFLICPIYKRGEVAFVLKIINGCLLCVYSKVALAIIERVLLPLI